MALERIAADDRKDLISLRATWDRLLHDLGGDPCGIDWSEFAPLRREREEDWSSWLAQLIADSETGTFAAHLFGHADMRPQASYARPRVLREHAVDGRRADLVIEWKDRRYTHIEFKVGDPHLAKTPDTVRKVRASMHHCESGVDFLLILPEQQAAWEQLRDGSDPEWVSIHVITWKAVSTALRRALLFATEESVRWRVWAHAFCGAIEQELLGLPGEPDAERWCRVLTIPEVLVATELLRAGRSNEENTNV